MTIDRRALVRRHLVRLTRAAPDLVLSVGNGDFAFTADVTGLQTFTGFHTPVIDMRSDLRAGPRVVTTATMASWGWDETPNPDGYVLDDAMSAYETRRGPVRYPDRPSMRELMAAGGPRSRAEHAGLWLVQNPSRVDLGRLGLVLRPEPGAEPETDPAVLSAVDAVLDPWTGLLTSRFTYADAPVEVTTAVHPVTSTVATRVVSPLLASGRLALRVAYAKPRMGAFGADDDWEAVDGHESDLEVVDDRSAVVHRRLATARYDVRLTWSSGTLARVGAHRFELGTDAAAVEVVATYVPLAGPGREAAPPEEDPGSYDDVRRAAEASCAAFWASGGAIDLAGSTDPGAHELERRLVLSQYLTRVHGAGVHPPQETGLVTCSWGGKFHLEMHWWHAAHFCAWGRPQLLERSLDWYVAIHPRARATAAQQGYEGARWPKQVGPDGRESPSDIGALLVWQQPHLLYYAELLWAAYADDPGHREALLGWLGPLLDDTAAFMASYADDVDGVAHLGPPLMPAQEFYAARETSDPTYELAYWWWGLDVANRFRERRGLPREARWDDVRDRLVAPQPVDGRYPAVAGDAPVRTDDHPSMLQALGFVPPTPLIDPDVMRATLAWVLDAWEWDSAWGWDFPVLAMTATRLGDGEAAAAALLRDASKNRYDEVGHNPQLGSFLPLYLPGNGGVLAAAALMVAGWEGGPELPGIPADGTWQVAHEGLVRWPAR